MTASRDGLISRRSRPCLGLRWGYETRADEEPELRAPSVLEQSDWHDALPVLGEGFPDWTFEDDWAD